jgi:DNA-directed RNA polymerase subunit M/transcription elongation factor TFIIS
MKNPTIFCSVCGEAVFKKPPNTKKAVVCQQCNFAKNARRKFVGVGAATRAKRAGIHHNRAPGGNIIRL